MVAIHPRHNKLITALRTAVENGEGSLDKKAHLPLGALSGIRTFIQFLLFIFTFSLLIR